VSLDRLQNRLCTLLSDAALTVRPQGLDDAGALSVRLAIVQVDPRTARTDRALPRDEGDGTLRRTASVRVTAALRVRAQGGGEAAAQAAARAVALLWWRLEAVELAEGTGFPDPIAEGYAVEALRPVRAEVPTAAQGGFWRAELRLEIDARIWPLDLPGLAGGPIRSLVVRLIGDPPHFSPDRVLVRAGATAEIEIRLDLRSAVWSDLPSPPTPPAREVALSLVGPDDGPALGTLSATTAAIDGDRARVSYTAAAPGRDRLRVRLRSPDGVGLFLGELAVEVMS
jgi:hypothetical protein